MAKASFRDSFANLISPISIVQILYVRPAGRLFPCIGQFPPAGGIGDRGISPRKRAKCTFALCLRGHRRFGGDDHLPRRWRDLRSGKIIFIRRSGDSFPL